MEIDLSYENGSQNKGKAPKVFLSIFCSIFLLIGLGALIAMVSDVSDTIDTYTWKRTPGVMLKSAISEDLSADQPFSFEVLYRYSYQGRSYSSRQFSRKSNRYADYQDVQRFKLLYPPESKLHCYLDPENPGEAVLQRESLWTLLLILVPLPFIAIGAGGLYATWFWKRAGSGSSVQAISSRGEVGKGGRILGVLFFFVFFAVGCAVSIPFLINPLLGLISAKDWVRTPAVVEYSRVKSHDSDDGTTYSVDILYAYQFQGQAYKSNRYSFIGGSSSGYRGKKQIVDQYQPSKKVWCYVNPQDPTEVVLNREFQMELFLGLIPLVFVLIGAGGMYFICRSGKTKNAVSSRRETDPSNVRSAGESGAGLGVRLGDWSKEDPSWLPQPSGQQLMSSGEIVLEPTTSPMTKVIALLVFAVIWNGIVSIFLYHVVESFQGGSPDWFAAVFLTPFVIIGLGTIIGVFYFLLALFNPRPKLLVSSLAVQPGQSFRLRWELSGRVRVLRDLCITLKGVEEARYRRGTSTYTDRNTFYSGGVERVLPHGKMDRGETSVRIPHGTMHSFKSENNGVLWSIELHGEIKNWPDLKEEFSIVVLPAESVDV